MYVQCMYGTNHPQLKWSMCVARVSQSPHTLDTCVTLTLQTQKHAWKSYQYAHACKNLHTRVVKIIILLHVRSLKQPLHMYTCT